MLQRIDTDIYTNMQESNNEALELAKTYEKFVVLGLKILILIGILVVSS